MMKGLAKPAGPRGSAAAVDDYDPRYLAGIVLFNEGDFFGAHEVWEDLWSESHGDARRFFQGLIQAAVGLCHFGTGNLAGARKLFHSSTDYLRGCPSPFLGLDVAGLLAQLRRCFEPLLVEGAPDPALRPRDDLLPRISLDPAPAIWPDPLEYLPDEDGADHE
jgi:hypothetical protein